jgi:RNA polymerase sigma factor (sigma-70 family)
MHRLEEHLANAREGDHRALEALVRGLQDDLYRLCLRMTGNPSDAEDTCQEALIKIVTHIGTFEGKSSVRTWAWKITSRHLMRSRRKRRELTLDFAAIEALIDAGANTQPLTDVDIHQLAEEVRLGCTQGMLGALSASQRITYIVSDIFGFESAEAAEILETEPATFRKRLERARTLLSAFMQRKCGLANPIAACRCVRQIPVVLERGLVVPEHLRLATHARAPVSLPVIAAFEDLREIDRNARVFQERANELAPVTLMQSVRELLDARRFGVLRE